MKTLSWKLLAVLAGALVAAAGSAPARAAFDAPVPISGTSGGLKGDPRVAVGAGGDAVIMWINPGSGIDSLLARTISAAGSLGPTRTIRQGVAIASTPDVAVDANGDAVFAWIHQDSHFVTRVWARSLSVAGTLGPIQGISAPGQPLEPRVAVDADGDAVIAWRSGNQIVAWGGGLRSIISPAGQAARDPKVAMDRGGDAVILWHLDNLARNVQVRGRSAGGVFGPVQNVATAAGPGPQEALPDPQVAVAPNGHALIVWVAATSGKSQIRARKRGPGGALGPVQNITGAGQIVGRPQVAVDADGDALIVWITLDGVGNERIQARARSVAGVLGPVQNIALPGQITPGGVSPRDHPNLAVGGNGDAVIVWRQYDGMNWRVRARTRSAAGALGPIEIVSNAGLTVGSPQVAVDADGDAVITWWSGDGSSFAMWAAVGP